MTRWQQRRQDRLVAGMCVVCGGRPHQPGRTACEPCAAAHAASAAKSRKVKRDGGTCVCCPAPALPGLTRCQRCRDANNNRTPRASADVARPVQAPRPRPQGPRCSYCGASIVRGYCALCQSSDESASELW